MNWLSSSVKCWLQYRKRGESAAGGPAAVGLSANGHVSRFLKELFPDADLREFQGTLTVTAEGGSIVGTAIQIGSRAGLFVALPAEELR